MRILRRSVLSALTAALLFGSITAADARNGNCELRVDRAQQRLHEAERRYGMHSRQAEQRRHQLDEASARCTRDGHSSG